jgi:hypothetical protein
MSGVIISIVYQTFLGCSNQEDEMEGACSTHGKAELHVKLIRKCLVGEAYLNGFYRNMMVGHGRSLSQSRDK